MATVTCLEKIGKAHPSDSQELCRLRSASEIAGDIHQGDKRRSRSRSNSTKIVFRTNLKSNSGDSFGGIVVHGEFATATVSSDGTATIAFEAADCNGCNDSDFAGSIERWSATGSATPKKGEGVDLARTQLSTAFQSEE